jgi:hypothetical protein
VKEPRSKARSSDPNVSKQDSAVETAETDGKATGLPLPVMPNIPDKRAKRSLSASKGETLIGSGVSGTGNGLSEKQVDKGSLRQKQDSGSDKSEGKPESDESLPPEPVRDRMRPANDLPRALKSQPGDDDRPSAPGPMRQEELEELRAKYLKLAEERGDTKVVPLTQDFRKLHREAVKGLRGDVNLADEREWAAPRRRSWPLPLTGLLAVASVILWFAIWKMRSVADSPVSVTRTGSEVYEQAKAEATTVEQVIRGFVEAATPAERFQWVSDGERIKEAFHRFYETRPVVPIKVKAFLAIMPTELNGRKLYLSKFEDEAGDPDYVILTLEDKGYRVEWESTMAYGELDWESFCAELPQRNVEMRVYLEWSNHYDGKYDTPVKYQSFYLTHPSSDKGIYAYVPRDSLVWERIKTSTIPGGKSPVNLLLTFESDAEPRDSALVVDFLHKHWIRPVEDPGEGTE